MNSVASLSALFASGLLAATLLPAGSEFVLFACNSPDLMSGSRSYTWEHAWRHDVLGCRQTDPAAQAAHRDHRVARQVLQRCCSRWYRYQRCAVRCLRLAARERVLTGSFTALGEFGRYAAIAALAASLSAFITAASLLSLAEHAADDDKTFNSSWFTSLHRAATIRT
jgi:hypothetical protein